MNVNQVLYSPPLADHLLNYLNFLVGQHGVSAKGTAASLPLPDHFILAVGLLFVPAVLKQGEVVPIQIWVEADLTRLMLDNGEGSQPDHPASRVIRQSKDMIPAHMNPKFPQYGFPVPPGILLAHFEDNQTFHNSVNVPEDHVGVRTAVIRRPPTQLVIDLLDQRPLGPLEIHNQDFQLTLNLLDGAVSRFNRQKALLLLEVPRQEGEALADMGDIGFTLIEAQAPAGKEVADNLHNLFGAFPCPCRDHNIIGKANHAAVGIVNAAHWVKAVIDMGLKSVQHHVAEDRGQAGRKGNAPVRFKEFAVFDNTRPQEFPQYSLIHWDVLNQPVVHGAIEESRNIGSDDPPGRILLIQLPEYVSVSVMRRAALPGEKGLFVRRGFSYRVKGEGVQHQHGFVSGGWDMERQFLPPLCNLLVSVGQWLVSPAGQR